MATKRVQFNVRVREEVARDLRIEAATRAIGMGELVELLNESYRAGTRSGHWLELDPTLEAALCALAAVRSEDPEQVLQGLVAGIVRQQLQKILDHLPSSEDILSGPVLAAVSTSTEAPPPSAVAETAAAGDSALATPGSEPLDELEIDASAWIEPSDADVEIEAMEWQEPSDAVAEVELEAMEWQELSDVELEAAEWQEPEEAGSPQQAQPERRRRSREAPLNDEQQQRLDALHPDLPRTGDQLHRFRQANGLSAAQLGALCDVTQVAVGLWERKGPLSATILLKLGAGLTRYFPS